MKLGLALAAVVAMGGCTLVIAETATFYAEDFEAELRLTSNVGCPSSLVVGSPRTVTVLEDSVVVDGRVYAAEIEESENGVARVEFTMLEQWMVSGRAVPVSIWLRGRARPTALDFAGTMSSTAPELAGCRVDVELVGRLPT